MNPLPTLDAVEAKLDHVRGMMVPVPEAYAVGELFNVIDSEVKTLSRFTNPPQDGLSRVWAALLVLEDLILKAVLRVQLSKKAEELRKARAFDEEAAERVDREFEENRKLQNEAAAAVSDAFSALSEHPHRQPERSEQRFRM
ncbi:hypothetical protein [Stenotrophomonas maltophilia]|uniref:hypothetical protein n=1 Tax=Stenotrophomonas maltophilia TaxID=40324 RepID=UPI001F53783D|nr:hypothetical protein [Stenotrophomonas maltophilia]MCI1148980.1 hypothetical protein [Stenotrophomonas maltophilia]